MAVRSLRSARSGQQGICALNAATGALNWTYAVDGATTYPETPPVVDHRVVIFGACGTSCQYVELDETTGSFLWTQSQPSGCSVNNGVVPAVWEHSVYATTGCDPNNSLVIALNEDGLSLQWELSLHNSGIVQGLAVAKGVIAIVLLDDGSSEWYAMPTNGEGIYWRGGGPVHALQGIVAPGLAYGNAYFEVAKSISGYTATKGKLLFAFDGDERSAESANKLVYSRVGGYPVAYAWNNGYTKWYDASGPRTYVSFPIVVNGVVYGGCDLIRVCAWTLPSMMHRMPS
jgi:hypothetical protein